jgi:putative ATP-binding cassette transporter
MGGGTVTKAITALVFIVGACFGLVQSIPIVAAASAAAEKIELLEEQLRKAVSAAELSTEEPRRRLGRIEFRDVEFSYIDRFSERPFKVGPLNFTLNAGDLVILTGGNGSGKSTFMKLLAGFYRPDTGDILLDGVRIDESNYETYRSLFTAIFPDFHLFQRLYGIPDPDMAELERLLTDLRLAGKTRLTDGEFRTVDLSSGQRRRLALIVSLLEKRPIMLLDEWAADQDPEFRRKFYFDLLPALHRAGATVVAISHDDRYIEEMDVPIRRLRMDEGRFVESHSMESA